MTSASTPGPIATSTVDVEPDPPDFDTDQRSIWKEQKDIYAAFLAGDRARIDRRIHPEATIWDGEVEQIARSREDLDRIRAGRPPADGADVIVAVRVDDPIITVFGDTAVMRHVLRVTSVAKESMARTVEVLRVSSAWRRIDDEWWIFHSHEDVHSRTTA